MTPHREVVHEVVGALPHRRCGEIELGRKLLLGSERRLTQFLDAAGGALEAQRSRDLAFGSLLGSHRRMRPAYVECCCGSIRPRQHERI